MDLITTCDQTRYAMEMLLPYRCKYCTRHFQNFLTYQSHNASHELKYHKFWYIHHRQPRRRIIRRKIRLAAKSSKSAQQVKYLYAKNSDGEVVVCDYKGKKLRKLLKNKVFDKVHVAGRNLPCQYMFAAYKSKGMVGEEGMEEVVKNRRKGGVRMMKNVTMVTEIGGRKYVCRVCDKQFNKSYAWELHEKSHSLKPGKMLAAAMPKFSCKICAKVFRHADVLKLHERSHSFMTSEKNSLPKITEGACVVKVAKVVLEDVISEGKINGTYSFHCKYCMQEFADRSEWQLHERSHTFMNSSQKVLTLKIRETVPGDSSVKLDEEDAYADSVKFELGDAFGDSFRLEEVKPSGDLLDMEIAQALADSVKVEQVSSLDGFMSLDHPELNHNQLQIDIKEELYTKRVAPSNVKQESAIAMPAPALSSYHESSYDADVDKKELLLESLSLCRVGSEPMRLQRVTTQLKEQLKKKTYSAVPIVKPTPFQPVLLPCCYCNMKFRTVAELAQHDKSHAKRSTSKRPFQCGLCGKIFTQSGSLRAHERIHTGERPYACHLCDKRFHESGKLRRHQRTHTGVKPYECRFCGRMFAQSGTRNSHQKTHREYGVGKMGMGSFSNTWGH